MENGLEPTEYLKMKFGEDTVTRQSTVDDIATVWIPVGRILDVLEYLKKGIPQPFVMFYDLTAIDERSRRKPHDYPEGDFTLVYHLLSFARNAFIRIPACAISDKTLGQCRLVRTRGLRYVRNSL
jgi:NADH-quinone oxidoreductase subunit C/D